MCFDLITQLFNLHSDIPNCLEAPLYLVLKAAPCAEASLFLKVHSSAISSLHRLRTCVSYKFDEQIRTMPATCKERMHLINSSESTPCGLKWSGLFAASFSSSRTVRRSLLISCIHLTVWIKCSAHHFFSVICWTLQRRGAKRL